jgi:peptidoglycan/LPS O-acetylase OafA/YrhL
VEEAVAGRDAPTRLGDRRRAARADDVIARLGDAAQGRINNVRVLRHVAAAMVIVFHCFALTARPDLDPLHRVVPGATLGTLGVQVFFVLSGFLVTQSFVAHPRLRAFAASRALRIYPALVAATLVTVALAGVTSTLPIGDYLAHPDTRRYLWRTATGLAGTDLLPGAYAHNPYPRAPNGSLWTLPIEIRLYVAIGIAGTLGILARRAAATLAGVVALALLVHAPWPLSLAFDAIASHTLVMLFVLGALAHAWRARLPLSLAAGAAALVLYVALPPGFWRTGATPFLVAYLTLVAAYHPRLVMPRLARGADLSYGLYVYAFPIQQTLLALVPGLGPWSLCAATVPPVAAAAALSWFALERPALALKSRFRPSPAGLP